MPTTARVSGRSCEMAHCGGGVSPTISVSGVAGHTPSSVFIRPGKEKPWAMDPPGQKYNAGSIIGEKQQSRIGSESLQPSLGHESTRRTDRCSSWSSAHSAVRSRQEYTDTPDPTTLSSSPRRATAPKAATTKRPSKPGAYQVHRLRPPGRERHTVIVPPTAGPGQTFQLRLPNDSDGRLLRITCPQDSQGGSPVDIYLDHAYVYYYRPLHPAALTASPAALRHLPRKQRNNAALVGGDRKSVV